MIVTVLGFSAQVVKVHPLSAHMGQLRPCCALRLVDPVFSVRERPREPHEPCIPLAVPHRPSFICLLQSMCTREVSSLFDALAPVLKPTVGSLASANLQPRNPHHVVEIRMGSLRPPPSPTALPSRPPSLLRGPVGRLRALRYRQGDPRGRGCSCNRKAPRLSNPGRSASPMPSSRLLVTRSLPLPVKAM